MPPKRSLSGESMADVGVYVDRAEAARKSRKAAPSVDVRGMVAIPQKDIIRRLAEKEGGVDKVMHRIFVGRDQIGQYADKGYAPVVRDGELVTYQSDVLAEIPVEFYRTSLAEAKALSDAMLGERVKKDAAQSRSAVSTGDEVTVSEVSASSLGMAATGTDESD